MSIRMHEPHFTVAPERARVIQALAVIAKGRVIGTLVNICARVAVTPKSGIAATFEGTIGVDALGVLVAATVVD